MKIVSEQDRVKTEQLLSLSSIKPGEGKLVRFQGVLYEEAVSGEGDACFYMVIAPPKPTPGRVALVSLDGRSVIERDESHLVHVHTILEIEITKPHLV